MLNRGAAGADMIRWLGITWAACSGTTEGTSGDTSGAADCAQVEVAACEASGCGAISGWQVVDDGAGGWCTDYTASVAVGCGDAGMSCTADIKWAAPASDPTACHTLGGCVPAGWVDCDPAMQTDVDCVAR